MELPHDFVLDTLLMLAREDAGKINQYSPSFTLATPKKQVATEIDRLNTRYPLRIGRPIYYDPVTGRLSLDKEASGTIRKEGL